MENNIKISFIVPVYNVEEYLDECINSIVKQSLDSKEIILVNDGSTDNSLKICNEYKERFNYIKVINKENGGLSSARNMGIENCTGNYIFFIDSDDFLLGDYLSEIYNMCIDNKLDIIRCVYNRYDDNNKKLIERKYEKFDYYYKPYKGIDFLNYEIKNNTYEVVACLGLFKREYLLKYNLRFKDKVLFEDHEFFLKCLLANEKNRVMKIDINIYAYRERLGSITKTYKLKNINDILENIDSMYKFIQNKNMPTEKINIALKTVTTLFYQLTSIYFRLSDEDKGKADKIIPNNNEFRKLMIRNSFNKYQKIKIIMFFYTRTLVNYIYIIKGKI